MPERSSTLAIALELLALASSVLDGCADFEDQCNDKHGLHSAADDIQEIIGNVKQETYMHEANQL